MGTTEGIRAADKAELLKTALWFEKAASHSPGHFSVKVNFELSRQMHIPLEGYCAGALISVLTRIIIILRGTEEHAR